MCEDDLCRAPAGYPCSGGECVDGLVCLGSTGQCGRPESMGAPCVQSTDCVAGLHCDQTTLLCAGQSVTQPCAASLPCASDLECETGFCVAPAGHACASDIECIGDLVCHTVGGACGGRRSEGAPCTRSIECDSSLTCDPSEGRCVGADLFDPCSASRPCRPGLLCDHDVCLRADDTPCAADAECASALCNGTTWLCAMPGVTDDPCARDLDCASPLVCRLPERQCGTITSAAPAPCAWGAFDCNPCVPDVPAAFAQIGAHGDTLGFHLGAPAFNEPGFSSGHWQGVQRIAFGDGRRLAVSRSGHGIAFVVATMASRDGAGLRWRSNRLATDTYVAETPPSANDAVTRTVANDLGFDHAGGMQSLGAVLAVPLENGTQSKVVFWDMSQPLTPERMYIVNHVASGEAGTASLARLADGHFLLIIGGNDADVLDFYRSTTTDLRDPGFTYRDTWQETEIHTETTDAIWANYQHLSLISQCDGQQYLLGTHSTAQVGAEDWADLFRVDLGGASDDVVITKVAAKQLYCSGSVRQCDFGAAGGTYVDPAGRLYIYGTEHYADGPLVSVKMTEFRPIPHGPCTSIDDAWVELYDDTGFGDRTLMIDYRDRLLEDYHRFDRAEGFEDLASSLRWCLPPGWRYRLWRDKLPCGGQWLDLVGTGSLEQIPVLSTIGFQDAASCGDWLAF